MRYFLPLIYLLLMAIPALAKSAEDYLHDASYKYIAGRHQEAAVAVEEGLRENPGDPRLHLLDDLLKQMKDQQRKDQNQSGGGDSQDKKNKQDQKDQQNKDQQNKNGNGSKQDQKDKQDQNSQAKDSSGQDKDKKQQPQPKPEEGKMGDSTGKGDGQPQRMPGQMSKEEAERLLNSFVDDEKKAQQNRQGTPRKRSGDQDW